jgi:hypothetical protein
MLARKRWSRDGVRSDRSKGKDKRFNLVFLFIRPAPAPWHSVPLKQQDARSSFLELTFGNEKPI